MTRIYYDPTTGVITGSATHPFQTDEGNYIDIEQSIKINEYKVDTDTLQLIYLGPQPISRLR